MTLHLAHVHVHSLSHSEQVVGRVQPSRMGTKVSFRASLSGPCLSFVLDLGGLCLPGERFEEVERPSGAGPEREKEEEVDTGEWSWVGGQGSPGRRGLLTAGLEPRVLGLKSSIWHLREGEGHCSFYRSVNEPEWAIGCLLFK